MNFPLPHLPERTRAPRTSLTMVMDKGLGLRQAEDLIAVADRVDFLKLGFGTSLFTPDLKEKVKLYREAGMDVYCGGTLFEAFLVRNCLDDYLKFIDSMGIGCLEISDGSMVIEHGYKCELIQRLSKDFTVLSEVGSKEEGILISPAKWIKMMRNELDAGSVKVIAEARESGTVGIYRPNSTPPNVNISGKRPKPQQVWFIKEFGTNVNLGNIAPNDPFRSSACVWDSVAIPSSIPPGGPQEGRSAPSHRGDEDRRP